MRRKLLITGIGLILPAVLLILIIFLSTCKHESEISSLDVVCFDSLVLPIFQSSCGISGCHDGTGEDAGYYLRNYNGIMEGITPYDPEGSKIYKALVTVWSENAMPPDQPLSETNRSIIRVWIEQGALETHCSIPDTTDTTNNLVKYRACFEKDILPIFQNSCAKANTGYSCHDEVHHEEDYILTSYPTVTSRGISAGNPNGSTLYLITSPGVEDHMPPSPFAALTSAERDSIYHWISYGALNETCYYNTCDTTDVTYHPDVEPILQGVKCYGCHNNSIQSGSVNFSTYSGAYAVRSRLVGAINHTSGYAAMPPSGAPLDDCSINTITIWVNAGAGEF
jgi:hypothetical protein